MLFRAATLALDESVTAGLDATSLECRVQVLCDGSPLRDLAGQDGSPYASLVTSVELKCTAQFRYSAQGGHFELEGSRDGSGKTIEFRVWARRKGDTESAAWALGVASDNLATLRANLYNDLPVRALGEAAAGQAPAAMRGTVRSIGALIVKVRSEAAPPPPPAAPAAPAAAATAAGAAVAAVAGPAAVSAELPTHSSDASSVACVEPSGGDSAAATTEAAASAPPKGEIRKFCRETWGKLWWDCTEEVTEARKSVAVAALGGPPADAAAVALAEDACSSQACSSQACSSVGGACSTACNGVAKTAVSAAGLAAPATTLAQEVTMPTDAPNMTTAAGAAAAARAVSTQVAATATSTRAAASAPVERELPAGSTAQERPAGTTASSARDAGTTASSARDAASAGATSAQGPPLQTSAGATSREATSDRRAGLLGGAPPLAAAAAAPPARLSSAYPPDSELASLARVIEAEEKEVARAASEVERLEARLAERRREVQEVSAELEATRAAVQGTKRADLRAAKLYQIGEERERVALHLDTAYQMLAEAIDETEALEARYARMVGGYVGHGAPMTATRSSDSSTPRGQGKVR